MAAVVLPATTTPNAKPKEEEEESNVVAAVSTAPLEGCNSSALATDEAVTDSTEGAMTVTTTDTTRSLVVSAVTTAETATAAVVIATADAVEDNLKNEDDDDDEGNDVSVEQTVASEIRAWFESLHGTAQRMAAFGFQLDEQLLDQLLSIQSSSATESTTTQETVSLEEESDGKFKQTFFIRSLSRCSGVRDAQFSRGYSLPMSSQHGAVWELCCGSLTLDFLLCIRVE